MHLKSLNFVGAAWGAIALAPTLMNASVVAQVWTQVATIGPSGRQSHGMAYDSLRGRAVLFGGSSGGELGDTWEWDGNSWAPMLLASGPAPRSGLEMVYDSQRGRAVLFGGQGANGAFGDTWEWDGSSWSLRAVTGPAPRAFHAMVYDGQRGRAVLFGGYHFNSATTTTTHFGDTWEWDGSAWIQVSIAAGPGRYAPVMAFDRQRGRTVLFGGLDLGTNARLLDTWEWDGVSWAQVATSGPSGRTDHAMVFDGQRGRIVLFGGGVAYPSDTWEWDGVTWTQAVGAGPGRQNHAMVYDSQRGRTVLFGGYTQSAGNLGDTWEWGGGSPGSAFTFGAGCGSPVLTLSPVASARPVLNTVAQASLANMPASFALVALGWSRTTFGAFSLPATLSAYGLPGCYLLQSSESSSLPVSLTGPGAAMYSLVLPNWPGLLGLRLYLQAWAPAPGANAGGLIVSNGVEWVIGNI